MDPATKAIALLVAALTAVGIVHGAAHGVIGAIPPAADLAYIAAVVSRPRSRRSFFASAGLGGRPTMSSWRP